MFRDPSWARRGDSVGESSVDVSIDGGAVSVDLTPHALAPHLVASAAAAAERPAILRHLRHLRHRIAQIAASK
jgi:hypothetical protein